MDPGLDLIRGQACCVNDRAVGQVGPIDSVWVYRGEAGAAVETSQSGKRVGSCNNAFLEYAMVWLALQDDSIGCGHDTPSVLRWI
jgi:hypothetical protein